MTHRKPIPINAPNILALISEIKGIYTEKPYPYSPEDIESCINTTAKNLNVGVNVVINTILKYNTLAVIDLDGFPSQYNLDQILISEALIPVFKLYDISKFSNVQFGYSSKYDIVRSQNCHALKGDKNQFQDLFYSLDIDPSKYKTFLDVCCNPGVFSLFMLENNPQSNGYGISLQQSKGGYDIDNRLKNNNRFKINYKDLLDDNIKSIKTQNKVDLAFSSCSIDNNARNTHKTQLLYANSYFVSMNNLKTGGDLLNYIYFGYNYFLLFQTLKLLTKFFKQVILYKSEKHSPGLGVAYIFCKGYNGVSPESEIQRYNGKDYGLNFQTILKYLSNVNGIFRIMNKSHLAIIDKNEWI